MIIYVDMDDVLCDYTHAFNRALSATPSVAFPQSQYGFYANLAPIEGALDTMNWLLTSPVLKPYILTAPSIYNPMSYTEKRVWVEKYLGLEFTERLIISPDKSLLKGDVLIDDRTEGHGQDKFNGELLHFGSPTYLDWQAIQQYLSNK